LDGLGEKFLVFIDNALHLIALSPERFPVKRQSYREFVVGKFPFVIVYEYLEEKQTIHVLHDMLVKEIVAGLLGVKKMQEGKLPKRTVAQMLNDL